MKLYDTHKCTITQDFTMAKLAIITWRYLHLQNLGICSYFKPLLTRVMIKSIVPTVIPPMLPRTFSTWMLHNQRLRHLNHSQATTIAYTFLVVDYQSSTATYTEVQVTLTVRWFILANGLLHLAHPMCSQHSGWVHLSSAQLACL